MVLVDFNIRMGLHPNSLQVVTEMGYGTDYATKQMADATRAAAENPSGSNLGEIGFGMMGMTAMQQMRQQQQGQQGQQPAGQQESGSSSGAAVPDVMTPEQAAAILQVSPEDVVAAIEAGDLKARKIGSAYRISRANLEEFLSG